MNGKRKMNYEWKKEDKLNKKKVREWKRKSLMNGKTKKGTWMKKGR